MVATILDLSNVARAAGSSGRTEVARSAAAQVAERLALPAAGAELHGRKAVDCMLNLALAGVGAEGSQAFEALSERAEAEVRRWGRRRSCSSMGLAQLVERTAAAGQAAPGLFAFVAEVLTERGEFLDTARALERPDYGLATSAAAARWVSVPLLLPLSRPLHPPTDELARSPSRRPAVPPSRRPAVPPSRRPARAPQVHRAYATSGKHACDGAEPLTGADWGPGGDGAWAWADGRLPLTLDLGCGYGCGPLSYSAREGAGRGNVLGCDLHPGGVAYARGVASRWAVDGRCGFVRDE